MILEIYFSFITEIAKRIIQKKKKILLGDFNTDLLKHKISDSINNFLGTLNSNFFLPLTFLPTRISKTCTLIDNILSNSTSLEETESTGSTQNL